MKVKDLVSRLQKYSQDHELVFVCDDPGVLKKQVPIVLDMDNLSEGYVVTSRSNDGVILINAVAHDAPMARKVLLLEVTGDI
jgi:hypothetical protein